MNTIHSFIRIQKIENGWKEQQLAYNNNVFLFISIIIKIVLIQKY